jgi:heptosyltransferase-1
LKKILIVRLGAMGDILHALPAVAALRESEPGAEVTWILEPKWRPLVEGSGLVHHVLPANRRDLVSLWIAYRWLARWRPDLAIDFQGLMKSAVIARCSGAAERLGFADQLREELAGLFYTRSVAAGPGHVVERNARLLGLAPAAAPLPPGLEEGTLPNGPFVLAAPFAGWTAKQWPAERYSALARRLPVPLVLNVAPGQPTPEGTLRHESSLEGLIHATRRATAVLGLDSGPMHLAAALGKPGVALFGPTDPARNGPHGGTIRVLRDPQALTSYKRDNTISPAMEAISVDQVTEALLEVLS